MYGVRRSNWFTRKWLPRALHNLWPNAENVPVRGRRRQARSPVRRLRFRLLTKGGRTENHAVALDEGQI